MESVNATEVSLKTMTLMIVLHVQFQDVNSVIKHKYVTHVLLKSISNKHQKMEPVSVKLTITLWIIRQNV